MERFLLEGTSELWSSIVQSHFTLVCLTELSPSLFYSITRTFASGKTEKGIFQALKDLGLPSGKVSTTLTVDSGSQMNHIWHSLHSLKGDFGIFQPGHYFPICLCLND